VASRASGVRKGHGTARGGQAGGWETAGAGGGAGGWRQVGNPTAGASRLVFRAARWWPPWARSRHFGRGKEHSRGTARGREGSFRGGQRWRQVCHDRVRREGGGRAAGLRAGGRREGCGSRCEGVGGRAAVGSGLSTRAPGGGEHGPRAPGAIQGGVPRMESPNYEPGVGVGRAGGLVANGRPRDLGRLRLSNVEEGAAREIP